MRMRCIAAILWAPFGKLRIELRPHPPFYGIIKIGFYYINLKNKNSKQMAKLKKIFCAKCKKSFYRSLGRFNEAIKFDWNQYCSRRCELTYKTKRQKIYCENCGKEFLRQLNDILIHNYCSRSCAATVNNKKFPKRHSKPILKACENCGDKTRNKKYCSITCGLQARRYESKELLEILKKFGKKLGRTPARRELYGGVDKACIRFFGSWNKAIETAGFIPNRSHNNRMYKRINAKATDGHLCDSISELLIDNWLHKNSILHERDISYPQTNHKADWKISTKDKDVFVEYFGLANDSPRYDRSIKEKETLCKKHDISLIGIYPKDIYPKNYLEDNLKKKFRDFLN